MYPAVADYACRSRAVVRTSNRVVALQDCQMVDFYELARKRAERMAAESKSAVD